MTSMNAARCNAELKKFKI